MRIPAQWRPFEPDAVVKEVLYHERDAGVPALWDNFHSQSGEYLWARHTGGQSNLHLKAIPDDHIDLIRKISALQER